MMSSVTAAERILPQGYRVDDVRSIGRRQLIRARPPTESSSGVRSYLYSDSGLWASMAHVRHAKSAVETVLGVGVMKVHVRLSGPSRVGYEHEAGRQVRAMSCGALIHPSGDAKLEHFDDEAEERSITVACNAAFLSEEYGLGGQQLPVEMLQFLEGREGALYGIDVPLLLEMRRAAEVIFEELASDYARPMMVESRALELLARFFEQVQRMEGGHSAAPMLARDRRIAESARVVLDECYVDPPSLKGLANQVGTHPAKLMRLFKAVHGSTISDYLEALRMERARTLLAQGDLPVTQIAYEVGYEHPSNFATAFKRRFGSPPSAVRTKPGREANRT